MAATKALSRKTFLWSHVGAITFHALLAALVLWVGIVTLRSSGASPKSHSVILVVVGALLLVVSLLSLWPVLMRRQYTIAGRSRVLEAALVRTAPDDHVLVAE